MPKHLNSQFPKTLTWTRYRARLVFFIYQWWNQDANKFLNVSLFSLNLLKAFATGEMHKLWCIFIKRLIFMFDIVSGSHATIKDILLILTHLTHHANTSRSLQTESGTAVLRQHLLRSGMLNPAAHVQTNAYWRHNELQNFE